MSLKALPQYESCKEIYACQFCPKTYRNELFLHRHKFSHVQKKSFSCDICGKTCRNELFLHRHKFSHVPKKKFSCDICGKTFRKESSLLNHQLPLHSNVVHQAPEKLSLTCKDCNKSFTHMGHLLRHSVVHTKRKSVECMQTSKKKLRDTDVKKFSCEYCLKSFSLKASFKNHYSTHLVIKQNVHSCELCNKTFKLKVNLKKHYMIHTGEKPYLCELCNKGFSTRERVKRHMVTHGNETPYKCDLCGKSFRQKGYLTTHATHWCSKRQKNNKTLSIGIEVKTEILNN